MDRADALDHLKSLGFGDLMETANRPETDTPGGYGPAIDSAYAYHSTLKGATITEVDEASVPGFKHLLAATVYDLVVPVVCTYVDTQVDAPLTSVKGSQLCRQTMLAQEKAWVRAAGFGYGEMNQVGGYVANLDYVEAGDPETE